MTKNFSFETFSNLLGTIVDKDITMWQAADNSSMRIVGTMLDTTSHQLTLFIDVTIDNVTASYKVTMNDGNLVIKLN